MTNPGAPGFIVTNDFAEGVGSHLGKYTLVGREQISATTGAVTGGAFIIVSANGVTLHGSYSGQAVFQTTSATWTAEGHIEGGSGHFAGASGTVIFTGVSELSTCKSVAALSVCSFTRLPKPLSRCPDGDNVTASTGGHMTTPARLDKVRTSDGISIAYRIAGEGARTLVALHGWGGAGTGHSFHELCGILTWRTSESSRSICAGMENPAGRISASRWRTLRATFSPSPIGGR